MPASYAFLTFSDVSRMRDASAKEQIRKHAMKEIGRTRRHARRRYIDLVFEVAPALVTQPQDEATQPPEENVLLSSDEEAQATQDPGNSPVSRALSPSLMDPFGTAAIKIDTTVQGLLQYFVFYSENFIANFTFCPKISSVVRLALQDELLIHCILSAAASRIDYVQGVQLSRFREREVISTQHGLHLLRKRLGSDHNHSVDANEPLVACMLYLGAGAIYRNDFSTAKIHVGAAMNLTEEIGGVQMLKDPMTLVRLLSMDDLLACMEFRPCKVKCTYDPGPMPSDDRESSGLGHEGSGFLANDRSLIPAALSQVIEQVIECHRVKCALGSSGRIYTAEAIATRHWLILRTLAARNRLLISSFNNVLTDALRVALIIWTLLPPSDLRQVRTARIISCRLRTIISGAVELQWDGDEDIRLWCLLVGYFGAHEGDETYFWFADEICEALTSDESGSWGEGRSQSELAVHLVQFQRRFLFHEKVLKPLTEKLACYIVQRQGRRSI